MVNLKIDDRDVTAGDMMTILEVAKREGISIPTLCHKDKVDHYTSCMVCLVKEKISGKFLASCSARVMDGMEIDTGSQHVIEMRNKSVELLLSEHRADCEAPCRIVCPAGYNIPLMNRLLAAVDVEKATDLVRNQLNTETLWCFNCAGYCQNACKRKKIDIPVSIKNLQIFISGKDNPVVIQDEKVKTGDKIPIARPEKIKKRFASLTGKTSEPELKEWLKETDDITQRYSSITDLKNASAEASACMHCDCRAADNCELRDIADLLKLKDPRGKIINGPAVKKINRKTNLIFENAKCIKCGLCVRICEESTDEPALCFIKRGFVTILSEPLTHGFEDVLLSKTKECIEICPTGALAWFKTNPADETDW
jgi:predicted molibdopterin-dependent oxidoreductase YjgC